VLNLNNIVWKDIPNYEGRYQVSNTGLVRSIVTNHGKPQDKIKPSYIRSNSCQYLYVSLSKLGVPTSFAVHRLVATVFVENPNNKSMVNHIDGNKLNNKACNLEWCTTSENHKHAYKLGLRNSETLIKRKVGEKTGKSSNFHNVSWDNSRSLWKATLKDKGKMIFQKRFEKEEDAAAYVNLMLDTLGYINRPRNVI
jgi:hypothetical protein